MHWWSDYYKRPYKDPILSSYSLEDLLYEYYSIKERKLAADERIQEEADKIEEAKAVDAEDWADKMEREEAESEAKDPAQDPDNAEWMEEQMRIDRESFGEDFGEDLNLSFDSPQETDE